MILFLLKYPNTIIKQNTTPDRIKLTANTHSIIEKKLSSVSETPSTFKKNDNTNSMAGKDRKYSERIKILDEGEQFVFEYTN